MRKTLVMTTHFRQRRMLDFCRLCKVHSGLQILDVGGNPAIWNLVPESIRPRVIFLNMPRAAEPGDDRKNLVFADGLQLPFRDQSFDLVFSNSVIEHVGNSSQQRQFAREIMRVGRRWWVQTPNRWFPVEQHLLTPFIHWLPKSWQRALVPHCTIWGLIQKVERSQRDFYFQHFLNDIRLLEAAEFSAMFPGSNLRRELFFGVTKSLIAVTIQDKLNPSDKDRV